MRTVIKIDEKQKTRRPNQVTKLSDQTQRLEFVNIVIFSLNGGFTYRRDEGAVPWGP